MNKYNHWLPKLFLKIFGDKDMTWYAVTWNQITYWSCSEDHHIPERYKKHEARHRFQQKRDGNVKWGSWYFFQWVVKGYSRIDYEREARAAELI